MRILLLSLGLLLAGGPALADEPIRTAGAGSAPPPGDTATAAQIDRWISQAPPAADDEQDAARPGEPRKVHGEVGVSVGTGGYRSGYVITHVPLGENGSATIAFGKTDYGRRLVPYYAEYPGPVGVPFE